MQILQKGTIKESDVSFYIFVMLAVAGMDCVLILVVITGSGAIGVY